MLISNWSERYFPGLPQYQHDVNNTWFEGVLKVLSPDGILVVPILQKTFDKQGVEVVDE